MPATQKIFTTDFTDRITEYSYFSSIRPPAIRRLPDCTTGRCCPCHPW